MSRYTIAAIPTKYAGTTFRSRLEATWAAFFDRLGWSWIYEPFETQSWIPDFAIRSALNAPRPVLVEVKPITDIDMAVIEKIDRADDEHEVLLVGCGPLGGNRNIGWLREGQFGMATAPGEWDWSEAPFGVWKGDESEHKNPEGLVGFCHAVQSFRDRITGCYDGGCWGAGDFSPSLVARAWGAAKDDLQWKPGREDRSESASVERLRRGLASRPVCGEPAELVAARSALKAAIMTRDDDAFEVARVRLSALLEAEPAPGGANNG
jgi:hypothetical protein